VIGASQMDRSIASRGSRHARAWRGRGGIMKRFARSRSHAQPHICSTSAARDRPCGARPLARSRRVVPKRSSVFAYRPARNECARVTVCFRSSPRCLALALASLLARVARPHGDPQGIVPCDARRLTCQRHCLCLGWSRSPQARVRWSQELSAAGSCCGCLVDVSDACRLQPGRSTLASLLTRTTFGLGTVRISSV